jgi:hypothetical protein
MGRGRTRALGVGVARIGGQDDGLRSAPGGRGNQPLRHHGQGLLVLLVPIRSAMKQLARACDMPLWLGGTASTTPVLDTGRR